MKKAHTKKNKRSEGGRRRKTAQRKTRKASSWTKKVTDLYYKMKKADKSVEFKDALKRASELKKKGQL